MANLIEGIQAECNRVRELLLGYHAIGAAGAFGAATLLATITEAEASIASGDIVRMVKAMELLRGCQ
jgi:hypothetical protein